MIGEYILNKFLEKIFIIHFTFKKKRKKKKKETLTINWLTKLFPHKDRYSKSAKHIVQKHLAIKEEVHNKECQLNI